MRTSPQKKKHVVDWAALALNDEIGEALRAELLREQAPKIHYFQQRIPLRGAAKLLPNTP